MLAILLSAIFSIAAVADTKISQLPLGVASTTNANDSFPYVDSVFLQTKRLKLSDLVNLPAFQTYNAPTCTLAAAATVATALANIPTQCSGGQFATGIGVNGNANCSTPSGGGGSSGLVVSSISSSATLTVGSPVDYQHIACDASGGVVVATVPLCSGNIGQVFNLKKVDSSGNSCSFARSGADVFDGSTSLTISAQYIGITIVCRAAGFWDIL